MQGQTSDRVRRRRHYRDDEEWMEQVFARLERRRALPFRRLEQAWLELADAAVGPLMRWLAQQPAVHTLGDWTDRRWPRWLTFWNVMIGGFVAYALFVVFMVWRGA